MPAYFSPYPPFRLIIAFALSLILHGSLLISDAFRRLPLRPSPPPLQVMLRTPEPAPELTPPTPEPAADVLLKNTLAAAKEKTPEIRPTPDLTPPEPTPIPKPTPTPTTPKVTPPTPAPRPDFHKPAPEKRPPARNARQPDKPHPRADSRQPAGAPPLATVQRKLAEFVFYPEEARIQGIEGTVYLFIQLGPDCTVEDVRIDGSSGSRLLDKAAEKGAWAIHQLPGCRSGVYPYIFRLVD